MYKMIGSKSSRGFMPVILIIILALIIAGGAGYFLYTTQYRSPPTDIVDETPQRIATPTPVESEISSVDATWNLYTNNVYGYSIKFPKLMKHVYGAMCEWREGEGGDLDSYRPNGGLVPTKIFENPTNNLVYISSEYFYQMAGETRVDGRSFYSECNRVDNSLALVEDRDYFMQQSWKFIFAEAGDDAELELFVKEIHGTGCTLREQTPAIQPGVFDVSINSSAEECFINSRAVIKYYPAANGVVYWNMGQAATFYESWGTIGVTDVIYDEEMAASFRFTE